MALAIRAWPRTSCNRRRSATLVGVERSIFSAEFEDDDNSQFAALKPV